MSEMRREKKGGGCAHGAVAELCLDATVAGEVLERLDVLWGEADEHAVLEGRLGCVSRAKGALERESAVDVGERHCGEDGRGTAGGDG